jgi:lysophospholipase L1-like esterase
VIIGRASVGLQESGANLMPRTNRRLTFGGKSSVTLPVGKEVFSDPVHLDVDGGGARRALAVSLYVKGASGPMTFHAAAFTTSYLSEPGAGDHTAEAGDTSYPFSTTSWFFVDGLEVRAPASTEAIVAFGDSITDGFFSTLNEDDRWPDALQRRLRAKYGERFAVINEAIGGNMVTRAQRPPPGCTDCDGVPALDRLDRDVLSQAGVSWVVWLEGINDIGGARATAAQVISGMTEIIQRVHDRGLCIIGATLTPSTGTAFNDYGTAVTDAERRKVNDFIRTSPLWDGFVDFDAATRDPNNTGYLLPIYNNNSTVGGAGYDNVANQVVGGIGDFLHPNRAGFISMAHAFDLSAFGKGCSRAR